MSEADLAAFDGDALLQSAAGWFGRNFILVETHRAHPKCGLIIATVVPKLGAGASGYHQEALISPRTPDASRSAIEQKDCTTIAF
jgi:hypothetical protein